jgi:hypothetical protein
LYKKHFNAYDPVGSLYTFEIGISLEEESISENISTMKHIKSIKGLAYGAAEHPPRALKLGQPPSGVSAGQNHICEEKNMLSKFKMDLIMCPYSV